MGGVYRMAVTMLCAAALTGCAAQPKTLYYWGRFQPKVYEHFRNETSPDQQIVQLEEDAQKAVAAGAELPPGYRAHLGLLYGRIGRGQAMRESLEQEKRAFPESARFMDYLLDKFKSPAPEPRS